MKIQRERFLFLTAALAGCHSGSPGPTTVDILIAAPSGGADQDAGVELPREPPTSLAARCSRLATGRDCYSLRELCEHYLEELTPEAASDGVECLERLTACDRCTAHRCTTEVLSMGRPEPVPECEGVLLYDESDWYRQQQCQRHASRMNAAGRRRYVQCVQNDRYAQTDECLWLPSGCDEGAVWGAGEL
ncbi:MAG: hypothetical protein KIT72_18585 [Polyangiaceae bacterium]|nr:hypothetical protein [Polyangiaceae bacterium]MCW5792426.1 hypothetical protein [Polyangiaceae bacterium]